MICCADMRSYGQKCIGYGSGVDIHRDVFVHMQRLGQTDTEPIGGAYDSVATVHDDFEGECG